MPYFDDIDLIKKKQNLTETSLTGYDLQNMQNSQPAARYRMQGFLENQFISKEIRSLGLYGFCKLSRYIMKKNNNNTFYICLGRSPTAIAAWLQDHTPNVCILPFSSARLENEYLNYNNVIRNRVFRHFDLMLDSYLTAFNNNLSITDIVLIDYTTSGESLFTIYKLLKDYFNHRHYNNFNLKCLALWGKESAHRTVKQSISYNRYVNLLRLREDTNGYFNNNHDGNLEHIYLEEFVINNFYYSTSRDVNIKIYQGIQFLLDNQSFDTLSPYSQTRVLRGANPREYINKENLENFLLLKNEIREIEKMYDKSLLIQAQGLNTNANNIVNWK